MVVYWLDKCGAHSHEWMVSIQEFVDNIVSLSATTTSTDVLHPCINCCNYSCKNKGMMTLHLLPMILYKASR